MGPLNRTQPPTHPAPLLSDPGVQLLPDELQHPADDDPDVLHVVHGQRLREQSDAVGSEHRHTVTSGHGTVPQGDRMNTDPVTDSTSPLPLLG